MPAFELPLILSYDTRNSSAYAAIAKDQRRVNCYYEITRPIVGQQSPDAALVRRPGVTDFGATYGSSGQTQYLVCVNPSNTWTTPTPWVFTKDSGNAIKVHDGSTSTTILTSADYYPRFVGLINISGTDNVVLQLQNTASPEGAPSQRVFKSTTIGTWTEITDADFTALKIRGQAEFMDGYMFIASGNGRIYQSALNDLTSWVSTDFLTRSITHDVTQGLMKIKNQIIIAGRESCEVYTNQGNAAGSVLTRVGFNTQRIGLAGTAGADGTLAGKTHYYAQAGDFIFFAGRFGGGASSVNLVAYDGNRFEKVTRTYEDKILSSTEVYGVYRVPFMGKIGIAMLLTAPGAATQKALMFVPDVNDWFEWESTIFSCVTNGVHFLGVDGTKLYHFPASNNYQDASTSFDMIAQFRIPRSNSNMITMNECGFVADTVANNTLSVSWSDDDGASFSTARTISLGSVRKRIHRCGTFRERLIKVTHSGSGEVRLHRFYADIEGGQV